MKHKHEILKLRSEGKTYNEIRNILSCSKSTISFHCSTEESKEKYKKKIIIKIAKIRKVKKNKTERRNYQYNIYIELWKKGEVSGGRGDKSGFGAISTHIRKYLFKKYENKCSKCGWSERNIFTNTIPLEIDHIDGNPMNHSEINLVLLCPNCHSLTKGHSTSKGNGRRYYREKYRREKVVPDGVKPPESEDN